MGRSTINLRNIKGGTNMSKYIRIVGTAVILAVAGMTLLGPDPAIAASAAQIDRDVDAALWKLYETTPAAKALAEKAKGILVFPNIVKAGFVVGAQYGDGALLKNGKTGGYYNIVAASYGLQAGAQSFGYAMFLMTDSALNYLETSAGWEGGRGPCPPRARPAARRRGVLAETPPRRLTPNNWESLIDSLPDPLRSGPRQG